MRKLNAKQKKLLDNWLRRNSHLPGLAACDAAKYIEPELWYELEELNDFETIWQSVSHYINNNAMKYNNKANPHFNNHLGL